MLQNIVSFIAICFGVEWTFNAIRILSCWRDRYDYTDFEVRRPFVMFLFSLYMNSILDEIQYTNHIWLFFVAAILAFPYKFMVEMARSFLPF